MKKVNLPMWIGGFILLGLICIMLFPEIMTHKSPYTLQQMRFFSDNGKLIIEKAPYPPSQEFWFGSDDLGRDIYSYIIYGTRLTILLGVLIAFAQFLIAIPLALLGGMGHSFIKSVTNYLNIVFSAIPALLISILVLQIDYFVSLDKGYSIVAFVLVLSFVGWPKLGMLLTERVEHINQQPFILGEVAIGKKRGKIARENIIPHLVPEIVVLFFMEIARNLSMMMQLGIFGVFIGNLKIILDSDRGNMTYYNISYEPEWASMLSTSRTYLTIAPWSVIFPALAFFISVLGFNLFGEGLRNRLQSKDSQLIPRFRKLIMFDIKALLQELKSGYIWKKKRIGMSLLVILMIFSLLFFPTNTFSYEALSDVDEDNVVIGTEAAEKTAMYIEEKMKSLSILPVEGEDYRLDYDIGDAYEIVEQQCSIKTNEGSTEKVDELIPNEEFALLAAGNHSVSGDIYDASRVDLYTLVDFITTKDLSQFKDKVILLDTSFYTERFIHYFMAMLSEAIPIKGFVLIGKEDEIVYNRITDEASKVTQIKVSKKIGEELRRNKNSYITINSEVRELDTLGRNIVGIYEGHDKSLQEEIIAVGLNYNYLESNGKNVLAFNLELMKRLCELDGNKRSIMFIFMDGTVSDVYHGIHSIAEDFPLSPQKVKVYIDLTGVTQETFDSLDYSSLQAQITRPFAWSMGQLMGDGLRMEGIKTFELDAIRNENEFEYTKYSANNAMYWDAGISTLIIATHTPSIQQKHTLNELGEILLDVIKKNNY